ncbi:hypothetical protein ACFVYJ_03735 [Pontibacter sp. JAM-7]|uniref:hypothetical protein n=1 Tax=Pontibacter sp. JAM-7 TaxID=3366581 RepID=UPI003AF6DBD0
MNKFALTVLAALLALPAYAEKPEHAGKKEHKKHAKTEQVTERRDEEQRRDYREGRDDEPRLQGRLEYRHFSDRERDEIRQYYNDNAASGTGQTYGKQKELPKGLQKKLERGGELPPGWQKKLARGEVLDPSLRGYAQPLPRDLLGRLHYDADAVADEVLRIQDKVVRVSRGEGTVIDIIDLADVMSGRGMRRE